jgi:hypothetical protein
MHMKCGNCGELEPLDTNFLYDQLYLMKIIQKHHYPPRIDFVCSCGSSIATGPEVDSDPLAGGDELSEWYAIHTRHQSN